MKDVTCIVNGHNEGRLFSASLKSVERSIEYAEKNGLTARCHIILDRADNDTREIAKAFISSCSEKQIEIEKSEVDYGDLSSSRNHGVLECSTKYVCFLDGDDLWCKNWLTACVQTSQQIGGNLILHPEYNIYFGGRSDHILHHVDMDDDDFDMNAFYRLNYWTALTFAESHILKTHPYINNNIAEGFGYEDWTWNCQTVRAGIKHKIVPGTAHFIRRSVEKGSLLDRTNSSGSIPRVLDLYCQSGMRDRCLPAGNPS